MRQWLESTEVETHGYRAVVEDLARFAGTADTLLSEAETTTATMPRSHRCRRNLLRRERWHYRGDSLPEPVQGG